MQKQFSVQLLSNMELHKARDVFGDQAVEAGTTSCAQQVVLHNWRFTSMYTDLTAWLGAAEVFVWGRGEYGRLGLGDRSGSSRLRATLVKAMEGHSIVQARSLSPQMQLVYGACEARSAQVPLEDRGLL